MNRAPLVPLEYSSQPSSKKNSHSVNKPHPTPPPTPFSVPILPSTLTPEGTKKYCCQACHGEDIVEVSFKSTPPKLDHLTCMEMVLAILQAHSLTLGDFIMTALDHEMPFSHSTRESLKHFIQGHTKKNHPIDVVHALYCHPFQTVDMSLHIHHFPVLRFPLMTISPIWSSMRGNTLTLSCNNISLTSP